MTMIVNNWETIAWLVAAIAAFFTGYDIIRNKGKLFVCDMVELLFKLIGKKNPIPFCNDNARLPNNDLALLEYLDKNKESLSETQRKIYEQLKSDYIDRSLKNLSRNTILNSEPADTQATEATREAVKETIEGNVEERRALALIANGNIDGGLELLIKLASESAVDNMKQWRNIGRLSYSVDTAKALAAYKKVIAFEQSDVEDAIYLGRLYQRTGSLLEASSIFKETLARLPESDERDRQCFSLRLAMYRRRKATYLRRWKATEPL